VRSVLLPPSSARTDLQAGSSHSRGFKDIFKLCLPDGRSDPGYELCPSCLESAGVHHALEKSLDPGSSPSPCLARARVVCVETYCAETERKTATCLRGEKLGLGEVGRMSVRISSYVTLTYDSLYPCLQNKTIEQIIDALRVAAFLRAGGISVLLVCSLIFAGRATGGGVFHRVRFCDH
jgi:hypothetical protein